jgi:predicted DNA-binding transcriptional regulator AlpA
MEVAGVGKLRLMADADTTQNTELLRGWRAVSAATGKSRVQLWRDIRAGRFPAPIEIGANSVAWFKVDVDTWKLTRPRRTYGATGGGL